MTRHPWPAWVSHVARKPSVYSRNIGSLRTSHSARPLSFAHSTFRPEFCFAGPPTWRKQLIPNSRRWRSMAVQPSGVELRVKLAKRAVVLHEETLPPHTPSMPIGQRQKYGRNISCHSLCYRAGTFVTYRMSCSPSKLSTVGGRLRPLLPRRRVTPHGQSAEAKPLFATFSLCN